MPAVDVNARLVELGYAWWYREYSADQTLADAEKRARAARRRLWADPAPLAPWEFRARQRAPQAADGVYWLHTASGVRHNCRCEHFGRTKQGRAYGPDEGKACGICGG